MRRPLVASLAVAAITILTLGACAPGSGEEENPPEGGGEKKLTYVYFTDGPDEQATRSLIKKFEQQNGATVDLQIVPFANLEQQLQARLSGGNAPDVARSQTLTPYRDDLLDLNQYVKDKIDGQFLDAAKDYTSGPDGATVAVPSDLTMNGPFVNTDQFKKAGVPIPKQWTWQQLVADAKKVQAANKTEFAIAYDKSGHRFAGMLSQFGTTYFGADGKSVALDQAKATQALSLFTDLHEQGVMPKDFWLEAGSRYKGANDIFLAKAAPVYISGNWQVSQFAKSAEFGWAAVPNPCAPQCGGFPGGKFMMAFKQSKNPQLAAEFIAFMNSAEAQTEMAKTAAFLPTRKDLISSGIDYPERKADMDVFIADVQKTPAVTYANTYSPAFDATARAAVNELSKAIAGQAQPAQAVEAIRAAAEKALAEAGG
jgi:alpha-1,4-digalacturonate transport system substrate-binding protein